MYIFSAIPVKKAMPNVVAAILDLASPPGIHQSCLCLLFICPTKYWDAANYRLFGPNFFFSFIIMENRWSTDQISLKSAVTLIILLNQLVEERLDWLGVQHAQVSFVYFDEFSPLSQRSFDKFFPLCFKDSLVNLQNDDTNQLGQGSEDSFC